MGSHPDPKIAIAGGGPAALTLGALLHQHNIPFKIIDLRPKPTADELDQPSGMLDLHVESGQAAIRACGLWDKFLPLTADCEESMVIADKDGTVLHADEGGLASRPEIARHNITRLMLGVVPQDAIHWGHKIISARRDDESTGKTTLELQTEDGRTVSETFDMVVGADGAWSKVRALLTDMKPEPSKLHYVTLTIKHVTSRFPALAQRVGKGTYIALANGHGLASQRGAQDSSMVTFFINDADVGVDHVAKLTELTTAELRRALLEDDRLFGEFGLKLKELANIAFDEEIKEKGTRAKLDIKPLVALPAGYQWETKSGVTLIGDAAHVMLPTAGEGVNCAMWDALDLSEVIIQAWEQAHHAHPRTFREVVDPLMRDFEAKMLTRSGEFSQEAAGNAEMMFGKEGAKGMMNFMAAAFRNALEEGSGGSVELDSVS
ncbi:hypothetical protein N0V82_001513 [Gnomoniopsis sp. IMI 355080]|nr:hypothetical protein N0V82_001513 [Gnomoniopsis sp. IMI 355080]